jgi:hypothetical protein
VEIIAFILVVAIFGDLYWLLLRRREMRTGVRPPVRWYWVLAIVLGAAAVVAINVAQQ